MSAEDRRRLITAAPANGRKRDQPTPSPLRRMADPTAHHVLPSRGMARPSHVVANTTASDMPPPPPRLYQSQKKRKVLDEDDYLDVMESIIQRDFFPDLPRLERQQRWLEALETGNLAHIKSVQRQIRTEQRKWNSGATPTPGPHHLVDTPIGNGTLARRGRRQGEARRRRESARLR